MRRLICLLSLPLFVVGCAHKEYVPREIVIVPDISGSIDPLARHQMFEEIKYLAQHLRRGDSLTIVPITGNANADLSGRTLYYEMPPIEDREAYDADLRYTKLSVQTDLDRLSAMADIQPGRRSDILGTIRIALQCFRKRSDTHELIVLSDFIEQDDRIDFAKSPPSAMKPIDSASILLKKVEGPIRIRLGRLQSSEFASLSANKQKAITAFWIQVMPTASIDPDGLQMLRTISAR